MPESTSADQLLIEFESIRPRLTGLAYRMLGEFAAAEDVVQDCFVKLRSRLEKAPVESDARVENWEAYAVRVASRLCLDRLRMLKRERVAYIGEWLPEPLDPVRQSRVQWSDDGSLRISFLLLLESLNAEERLCYVLRRVFDYGYDQLAEILSVSNPNVRKLFSRAQAKIQSQSSYRPKPIDTAKAAALVKAFIGACQVGNLKDLVSLLVEDCVAVSDSGGKATSAIRRIIGASKIARFFIGISSKVAPNTQLAITEINGELAIGVGEQGQLHTLQVFSLVEAECAGTGGGTVSVESVYIYRNPDKLSPLNSLLNQDESSGETPLFLNEVV